MASTSLSRVARLENWFWTPSPPARDALSGVIFDDPPPRSWPDGTAAKIFNVSELEQRGAAEGKIIMTVSGRRYLLGKAATHASLAAERDAAQREAEALREQLEELQSAARPALTHLGRKKRPRGRAPAGCGWDEQRGGWFDENGKLFELVDQLISRGSGGFSRRSDFSPPAGRGFSHTLHTGSGTRPPPNPHRVGVCAVSDVFMRVVCCTHGWGRTS